VGLDKLPIGGAESAAKSMKLQGICPCSYLTGKLAFQIPRSTGAEPQIYFYCCQILQCLQSLFLSFYLPMFHFLDDLVVQFALAVLTVTVTATAIACIGLRITRFF
jgi:hypothetical protein